MTHELKTWPKYFRAILNGNKRFEIRKNDRDFKVGDSLKLLEWDNVKEVYTGRWCFKDITYILEGGNFGVQEGFVVMSII